MPNPTEKINSIINLVQQGLDQIERITSLTACSKSQNRSSRLGKQFCHF